MEKIMSKILIAWISFIFFSLYQLRSSMDDKELNYYHFGPNTNLTIIGISINDYYKYFCVISYCIVNSVMRSIVHNILYPWMTNSIQDVTKKKEKNIHIFAYEVTYVISVYTWVDWYLYLNFLLSQVDIFLVEISIDLIMAGIITYYYLNKDLVIENIGATTNVIGTINEFGIISYETRPVTEKTRLIHSYNGV